MTRYLDDDGSLRKVYVEVVEKHFPIFINANTKLFFDTKKRKSKGRIVLGKCKLAKDMEKFLTKEEVEYGYDYFIAIDKKAWDIAEDDDKARIMRHECRHMGLNDVGDWALTPHDVEDFAAEIDLNKDKSDWGLRLAELTEAAYEQEKEAAKK